MYGENEKKNYLFISIYIYGKSYNTCKSAILQKKKLILLIFNLYKRKTTLAG